MINGVIFDMDGLMFDTERMWATFWEPALAALGLEYKEGLAEAERGTAGETSRNIVRQFYGEDCDANAIIDSLHRVADEEFQKPVSKKPGLDELLAWLDANHIPMAVASSSRVHVIEGNLNNWGLTHYFKALVSGQQVKHSKPDPEIFLLAAEKLGTDPYGERLLGHRLEDALSGPMSCNWGLIEGDAQHLWVKLNYRYPVTMERADCQPAVQAAFEAAGWALDGQVHKEKLYYPAETPLVSALLEVYRDATGDNAPPKCIGGGTYAKMLPNVVAFGPLFAGDPVTEHQPDECIDLERLVQNAQIIANAIVKLANLPLE